MIFLKKIISVVFLTFRYIFVERHVLLKRAFFRWFIWIVITTLAMIIGTSFAALIINILYPIFGDFYVVNYGCGGHPLVSIHQAEKYNICNLEAFIFALLVQGALWSTVSLSQWMLLRKDKLRFALWLKWSMLGYLFPYILIFIIDDCRSSSFWIHWTITIILAGVCQWKAVTSIYERAGWWAVGVAGGLWMMYLAQSSYAVVVSDFCDQIKDFLYIVIETHLPFLCYIFTEQNAHGSNFLPETGYSLPLGILFGLITGFFYAFLSRKKSS